jgi:hypothetical protein
MGFVGQHECRPVVDPPDVGQELLPILAGHEIDAAQDGGSRHDNCAGYQTGTSRQSFRKLHSRENGTRLKSTARSFSTSNRSLGFTPMPRFAS